MYLHLCSYAGEHVLLPLYLPLSSQIASELVCYVREHKLNFRNREMLEKRKTHPFEEIEASLSQIWLKPDNSGVSL